MLAAADFLVKKGHSVDSVAGHFAVLLLVEVNVVAVDLLHPFLASLIVKKILRLLPLIRPRRDLLQELAPLTALLKIS